MTRKEQAEHLYRCEDIIRCIVDLCNKQEGEHRLEPAVFFGNDWGGNSVTVLFPNDHTHVGFGDTEWADFIENLHEVLVERCKRK